MWELKDLLFAVGKQTYQAPEDLLAAMEQIVEKTGDFDLAVQGLKDMGFAGTASAAALADIGAVTSNLNQKLGITKAELREAFDILIKQGDTGAFTLQKMAGMGERLFTSAASFGVKGIRGLREFGAFIQMVRTGTGSEEQATTAIERTFADLIQNYKKIRKLTGFSVIDPEKSRKAGRTVFKDLSVVVKEIVSRTKGDQIILRQLFGEESIRAINAIAESYKKFGDFREFDDLVRQGGDGSRTMQAFAFWTGMSAAKVQQFRTTLLKFSNDNLHGPIELLTKALDVLNNHPIVTKGGLYTVLGLGGFVAAGKAARLIAEAFRVFTGKGMPGGKGGSLPGKLGGGLGMPVYVTNWPGGAIPGSTSGPGNTKGSKVWGRIAKWGRLALPFVKGGLGIWGALEFLDYANEPDVQEESRKRLKLAEMTDAHMRQGRSAAPWIKGDINIVLEDRRTTVTSNNMNTNVNMKVNSLPRGDFQH